MPASGADVQAQVNQLRMDTEAALKKIVEKFTEHEVFAGHLEECINAADGSITATSAEVRDVQNGVADLNEVFDARLPEDKDYDTLAGLLFDRFGHIPTDGESVQVDGVVLEVVEADDRRIQRVRVTRAEPGAESGPA